MKAEPAPTTLPAWRGFVRMWLYEIDPQRFSPDAVVDVLARELMAGGVVVVHSRIP